MYLTIYHFLYFSFFAEELQFKPTYMQCTMMRNFSPNPINSNRKDSVSMERLVIRRMSCHLVLVSYYLKPKLSVTNFEAKNDSH